MNTRPIIAALGAFTVALMIGACEDAPKDAERSATGSDTTSREVTFADLLFADQSLSDLIPAHANADQYSNDWREIFAYALQLQRDGKTVSARDAIRRVLALPDLETRARLLAWKALRDLGEQPTTTIAGDVQGVVMQVPVKGGVDMLAAYSDGSARYMNRTGAIVSIEAEEDRYDSLIVRYLRAGESLVRTRPVTEGHRLEQNEQLHMTALTYGGNYAITVDPATIDESPETAALFDSGTALMLAMLEKVRPGNDTTAR